ncbi:hypothetical protein ABPG74_008314 [Tetrahymena malaccensis]
MKNLYQTNQADTSFRKIANSIKLFSTCILSESQIILKPKLSKIYIQIPRTIIKKTNQSLLTSIYQYEQIQNSITCKLSTSLYSLEIKLQKKQFSKQRNYCENKYFYLPSKNSHYIKQLAFEIFFIALSQQNKNMTKQTQAIRIYLQSKSAYCLNYENVSPLILQNHIIKADEMNGNKILSKL